MGSVIPLSRPIDAQGPPCTRSIRTSREIPGNEPGQNPTSPSPQIKIPIPDIPKLDIAEPEQIAIDSLPHTKELPKNKGKKRTTHKNTTELPPPPKPMSLNKP